MRRSTLNGSDPSAPRARGEEQGIRNALAACGILRSALDALPATSTLNSLERALSVVLDGELRSLSADLDHWIDGVDYARWEDST